MATSILCRKRGLSDAFGSPSCSPHKIAFLDLADLGDSSTRRAKRSAQSMEGDRPQGLRDSLLVKSSRGLLDASVSRARHDQPPSLEQSPFVATPAAEEAGRETENVVSDKAESKLCRACKQRPAEKLFTLTSEEIREIVQRAVARRESEVRKEYDEVLSAKLSDQFNNFRKFHEDYVSRQLNQSDYSYMS